MRSPPAAWRRPHLLAASIAGLLAAGCEKQPAAVPAAGPPAAPASQPQTGGASSPQAAAARGPAAASGEPAAVARDAALVRDFRLGIEELGKEMADRGAVERRREKAADVLLQSRVTTRLWDDPSVPAGSISVSVKEGHITLDGRVGTVEQVQRALLAALAVTEVSGVTSKLSIGPDDGSAATHATPR